MRIRPTVAVCVISLVLSASGVAAEQLRVSITPQQITATGVTPGKPVLFFGVGLEPKRRHAVAHRWSAVVHAEGGKGVVTFDLDAPVTWNVLWVVVDLTSGHHAIASTPGYPTIHSRFTRRDFKRDAAGDVNRFIYSRSSVDLLYIVPGGGAWKLRARDGDDADADRSTNGLTAVDLASLQPLGDAGQKPRAFTPGGTLFVIDSDHLDLLELKIDGAMLAGAH